MLVSGIKRQLGKNEYGNRPVSGVEPQGITVGIRVLDLLTPSTAPSAPYCVSMLQGRRQSVPMLTEHIKAAANHYQLSQVVFGGRRAHVRKSFLQSETVPADGYEHYELRRLVYWLHPPSLLPSPSEATSFTFDFVPFPPKFSIFCPFSFPRTFFSFSFFLSNCS